MKKVLLGLAAVAMGAAAIAPGLRPLRLPRGHEPVLLADLLTEAQQSGLTGWDLVDFARRRVFASFHSYSCEHSLLPSTLALYAGQGFSVQYNGALKHLLTALGFEVASVFCARTRSRNAPWWHSGHMWLVVTHDGDSREICVQYSRDDHSLAFTPATEVLPFGMRSELDARALLVITSAFQWWKRTLTGREYPRWFKHPFGELG